MFRLIGVLITIVVAILAAITTWPQFFHLEQTYPIAQVVALRSGVVLAFAGLFVLTLLLCTIRRLRAFAASLAVIALLAGAANAAILLVRGTGTQALPSATDDSIRVMVWNTAGEATDPEIVARTAVAMQADIVALPETTLDTGRAAAVAMKEMGSPMWVHDEEFPGWDANWTTILVSPELGDYAVVKSDVNGTTNTSTVPSVVIRPVDHAGPTIVAVHAIAPREEDMDAWRQDLRWIADQCGTENVILAGDFNATVDHMAHLGEDGATMGRCHDAAAATGNGAIATWPTATMSLLGAPIDHVMATDAWEPAGTVILGSLDEAGSDHRALVVQLEPTKP